MNVIRKLVSFVKSKIISKFVNISYLYPLIFICEVLIIIIFILLLLLTPLIQIPLFTQQNTIFDKTIYPEDYYSEKIEWNNGLNPSPHIDIYLSLKTDRDVYLYIFNQTQYLHYLERKVEDLSITDLECIASIKDEREGIISINLDKIINPLYIVIDTDGASIEVEIISLNYRYTIFERSWYYGTLVIFISFLITAVIAFLIKRRYNPWKYFHDVVTNNAYKKFKDGNYDDSILSVFNVIDPLLKNVAERKGKECKNVGQAVDFLFNENDPILKLTNKSIKDGNSTQYKLLLKANFSFNRNPIAHNNIIFQKYEALRQLGILDELIKILETYKITCECGSVVDIFEYDKDHNHPNQM